ncbi:hypothetical protein CHLRE_03g206705v5 [Chlamydomonas reinhardtii]|uniref:O-fucosyltransferase family protein n=1 Tax=Chlamydomonas reinhardtii TaxID=3055 RepID=A8JBT6_CHLRE|nr:uncharacterized protein CHLRE_03g206705v5 [Chlamydomonas reinhardtii]PNW86028.1 hypothetical protein CHLRE_03g206705v5 [Chlamydomonas reinhardtii]|eukprot:XP_001699450.1 predicted protein [Chlamydomonas reinhardtii]
MSSSTSLATSSSGWSPVSGGPWRWRRRLGDELGEKPEAAHRLPELPGGYLYPVLAWGPNNQVAGLKEALVLGRMLGRTVIVHDILNHYDDKGPADGAGGGDVHRSMDFSLVFDFDHLSRHQSVVTLAERLQAGWDAQLDAVAHFGPKFLAQIKNARALNVSDERAEYIDFERFDCSADQMEAMKERLMAHEVVAFIVYENIVRDAGHGIKLRVTGELCHDEYLRVSAQLTKSEALVELATEFRAKRLGGGTEPYMAIHVRPYPDTCLYLWKRDKYNIEQAARSCKNKNLYNVFVQQTVKAMKARKLKSLFVMSYPDLRPRISAMFGEVGVSPIYYSEADLEEAVGYKSVSLLGMVEEEIAYEADAFIGTSYSSMSSIIMQERFARGKPKGSTSTFTRTS